MIYTFTANLAIDLFIETNTFKPNFVNRTNYSSYTANGKGVNVSIILKKLNVNSIVTGFKAGFTGNYIQEEIEKKEIPTFLPDVPGVTRINVFTNVLDQGVEYKQVNPGPRITEEAKKSLLAFFSRELKKNDFLTINGSFPEGIDENFIAKLCRLAQEKAANIIIDNSADFVPNLCKYKPLYLKPNETELCDWFDIKVANKKELICLAKELISRGAQNILLSLGGDGAILVKKDIVIYCNAPKGKVVNTAMAGDTLLATFLAAIINGETEEIALKKAVAAGSSTAFTEELTDFSDIEKLEKEIEIEYIGGN